CLQNSPRLASTAHVLNPRLGWVEIRHPFHPLKGQRFLVLKERRIAGVDTLIVRNTERGSFAVAKEWTDRATPSSYEVLGMTPGRLDIQCLLELIMLVDQLAGRTPKELAK
ncbi:MAG: Y4bD/Y4pK family protein, partial [Gammaproteobacteria bacterium]|nr:Y4bD/Y4pK family protein [Gammaproteobacteria bacterium]